MYKNCMEKFSSLEQPSNSQISAYSINTIKVQKDNETWRKKAFNWGQIRAKF